MRAFGRKRDADAPPVGAARAHDQPGGLEPVEVGGHPGGRDPLPVGELAAADVRGVPDRGEQRHLPGGDAELVSLAPHEPAQPQQYRPKLVGEREGIIQNMNH